MSDIQKAEDIEYCDFYEKELGKIKRVFLSKKVQSRVPLRLKIFLYKSALKYKFFKLKRKEKILFVFSDAYAMVTNGEQVFDFIKCLKKWFVNAKFVFHKYDCMVEMTKYQLDKKELFDLFLTFNRLDAEKYGIEYYGAYCECGSVETLGFKETCDLVYVGRAGGPERSNFINIFK